MKLTRIPTGTGGLPKTSLLVSEEAEERRNYRFVLWVRPFSTLDDVVGGHLELAMEEAEIGGHGLDIDVGDGIDDERESDSNRTSIGCCGPCAQPQSGICVMNRPVGLVEFDRAFGVEPEHLGAQPAPARGSRTRVPSSCCMQTCRR